MRLVLPTTRTKIIRLVFLEASMITHMKIAPATYLDLLQNVMALKTRLHDAQEFVTAACEFYIGTNRLLQEIHDKLSEYLLRSVKN